jgi:hypothetical protein
MSYAYNRDDDSLTINPIDNAIVPHSDAPVIRFALEFLDARWQWILTKLFDLCLNSLLHLMI